MTIKQFDETQMKMIRNIWSIDCPDIENFKNNQRCDIHEVKHIKLPDLETWKILKMQFPNATLNAWGEVFYVTRESIRLLNNKLVENSEENVQSWVDEKNLNNYGKAPINKLFEDFFNIYINYPNKGKKNILNFLGIKENYFTYWIRENRDLSDQFNKARKERAENKKKPDINKCYRCGHTKEIADFGKDKNTASGYSDTCKNCNRENAKKYNLEKRQSEKICLRCKKSKHVSKFSEQVIYGDNRLKDICISCRNQRRLFSSKQRMLDAGIKDELVNCIICKNDLPIEEYYLRRSLHFDYGDKGWLSKECRLCVRKELNKYPNLKEPIMIRWNRHTNKIGPDTEEKFVDFLNTYLQNIKSDLKN